MLEISLSVRDLSKAMPVSLLSVACSPSDRTVHLVTLNCDRTTGYRILKSNEVNKSHLIHSRINILLLTNLPTLFRYSLHQFKDETSFFL